MPHCGCKSFICPFAFDVAYCTRILSAAMTNKQDPQKDFVDQILSPSSQVRASFRKRLACTRCHAQKLRCLRHSFGDCTRCLRAGSICVARSPRPMGRPKEALRGQLSRFRESANQHTVSVKSKNNDEVSSTSSLNISNDLRTNKITGNATEGGAADFTSLALSENFWDSLTDTGGFQHYGQAEAGNMKEFRSTQGKIASHWILD